MADESKIGTDWQDAELDLILADYFTMLGAEQRGEPYVKARHNRALAAEIGRTHASVEFKHMNISAVLRELGRPTIRGYKARDHYQDAMIEAVDRFLTQHPELDFHIEPSRLAGVQDELSLFAEMPPVLGDVMWARTPAFERLVRKFDPAARDERNRSLGLAGEELIVGVERQKLRSLERPDLATRVRWVSQEDGDGAGYDILSFDATGRERLIEVKTTAGSRTTPFYLSRNEHDLSTERPDAFRLYRVFEFAEAPRLFKLKPPLAEQLHLSPEVYRASF